MKQTGRFKTRKKSKIPLVVFVLIFGAIGAVAILKSFAATANGKFVYIGTNGLIARNGDGTGAVTIATQGVSGPIARDPSGQYVEYIYSTQTQDIGKVVTIDGKTTTTFATPKSECINDFTDRLWNASFSSKPDGTQPRLVFIKNTLISNRLGCDYPLPYSAQLIAVDANGSNRTLLASSSGEYKDVTWSPDGNIYFIKCNTAGDACSLMVRKANGSLVALVPEIREYKLSGDGKKIVYTTKDLPHSIQQMNSDGTGKRTIFSNTSSFPNLGCVGRTGHVILYAESDRISTITNLHYIRDDSPVNKVIDSGQGIQGSCDFSPLNDYIVYNRAESNDPTSNKSSIYRINAADLSGKTQIAFSPSVFIGAFDW